MFTLMKNSRPSSDAVRTEEEEEEKSSFPHRDKILAALFYGLTSLAVIFSNKSVMTNYNFPYFDFLAFVQFTATTFILSFLVLIKKLDIPFISWAICKEVLPISCMFLGNVLCGLGGTRSLNLPMFTALRRFSILMTMLAEYYILGNKPSSPIVVSIFMMVGGALLAAVYDLKFEFYGAFETLLLYALQLIFLQYIGYMLVFLNNCFTTLNGVWMKKASMSGRCSKIGILFYNSLFSAIAMLIFFICEHVYITSIHEQRSLSAPRESDASITDKSGLQGTVEVSVGTIVADISRRLVGALAEPMGSAGAVVAVASNAKDVAVAKVGKAIVDNQLESTLTGIMAYNGWLQWDFLALFALAAMMGCILNYSIFLCTTLNSALTTAVIGCLKNVATTYIGMIFFPDYVFEFVNFVGLNISIAGSLYYTYMTMFKGMAGFGGG